MPESDEIKPRLTPEGKFALVMIACMIPIFILFTAIGSPEMGMGASICSGVLAFGLRPTWHLRNQRWFWLIAVAATLLQLPFVLYFPWGNRALRPIIFPACIADLAIIYGCTKLGEKLIENRPADNLLP